MKALLCLGACVLLACAESQAVRRYDGAWWLTLSEDNRSLVIDGYIECYRTDIVGDLSFSETGKYEQRIAKRLEMNPSDRSITVATLLEAEAAKSPPRKGRWPLNYMTDEAGFQIGDYWIAAGNLVALPYVQGYLECQHQHPDAARSYTRPGEWYATEGMKWLGWDGQKEDEKLVKERHLTRIVDVMRMLRNK